MRIHEIILFEADQQPRIGQPVRSRTRTKATLGNMDPSRGVGLQNKWQIIDRKTNQPIHDFVTKPDPADYKGPEDEPYNIAREWLSKNREWLSKNRPDLIDPIDPGWTLYQKPSRMVNIGQGAFKGARVNPLAPGLEITKREFYPDRDTGGNAWLQAVSKYNRRNPLGNPWLPVITRISKKTDWQGRVRTQTSEMSLEDGASLSPEAILSFATRIFPNFENSIDKKFQKWLLSNRIDRQQYDNRFKISWNLWDQFVSLIRDTLNFPQYGNNPNADYYSRDDYMKRALRMAKNLEKKGHRLDIHSGNIMVRNTGRGWQPVLTDPLS